VVSDDYTLGSLFDGISAFPLAAERHGITTLWGSEIEPAAIKVSKLHYPNMKQLGDITKINGADIDPVDIICGGFPCQDLSIAGKRVGLQGSRSGLFWEMCRIVREMQEATNREFPKLVVFENVPGLLSSNKGEDFYTVLDSFQELGFIIDTNILDAQYMGVPQRRKRVFGVWQSVDHIRKMKTNTSFSIITQLLIETLLCILNEQLSLSEKEPKESVWKQKKLTADGLKKKMKLFSIEKKEVFETLLNNWTGTCQTLLKEQYDLDANSDKLNIITKADISKSEFQQGKGLEKLFGNTSKLWKRLLDDLYYQENLSITLIVKSATMNQIIYGCANLLENMALLTGQLKSCYPNLYETRLYILTGRKVCIDYARERQANDTLFDELGWVQRWDDYIQLHTKTGEQIERYFGGQRAGEILFKPESMRRDIAESECARERTARNVENGIRESIGFRGDRDGLDSENNISPTLMACEGAGGGCKMAVCYGPGGSNDIAHALRSQASKADKPSSTTYVVQVYGNEENNEVANTLLAKANSSYRRDMDNLAVTAVDCRNYCETKELSGTLQSKSHVYSVNYQNPVRVGYAVRRLTPTECCRLMGFPDNWCDILSDTQQYKCFGNSIAIPCAEYVMSGIKQVLDRQ
jgi:DNA-cytosine methyltransferase